MQIVSAGGESTVEKSERPEVVLDRSRPMKNIAWHSSFYMNGNQRHWLIGVFGTSLCG
jgi:hypothetical protein